VHKDRIVDRPGDAARFSVPPTVWVINAAIVVQIGGDA